MNAPDFGKEIHVAPMTYGWRIFTSLPAAVVLVIGIGVYCTSSNPVTMVDILTLAMITGILAVPAIFIWRWHGRVKIHVHEKGIVRDGYSTPTCLSWKDVLYIRYRAVNQRIHGVSLGTSYYVTLVGKNREKIKLSNNVKNASQVITYVIGRVLEEQLPVFNALIDQGNEIPFGKIFVGREGLRVKKKMANWGDISEVKVDNGNVRVRLKNKILSFYSVQFASLPNGHAFLQLCQQRLGTTPLFNTSMTEHQG